MKLSRRHPRAYLSFSILPIAVSCLLGLWLPPSVGRSQESAHPNPSAAPAEESVTLLEQLKALSEAVAADATLTEEAKASIIKVVEEAITTTNSASQFAATSATYRGDVTAAPEETARIRADLEKRKNSKAPAEGDPELPADATAEQIAARLATEKARLSDLTAQLRDAEAKLAEIESRSTLGQERLIEVRRLSSDAEGALSGWASKSTESLKDKAGLALAQSRSLALRRETEMLEQESLTHDLRRSLLEARRDQVSADLVVSRNRLTALEEKTAALVNARISEAEKLVETTGLEALKENTLVEELMAETKRLAAETQLIFDKIAQADATQRSTEADLLRLRRDGENIRTQIEIGGLEDSFGQIFLEIREEIPKPLDFRARSSLRRKEIAVARLAAFRADRDMELLPPVAQQLEIILKSLREAGTSEADLKPVKPALTTLIETRLRLQKDSSDGNRRLARQLGEVELVESEILAVANQLRDYLGEKLLWVASSPPLSLSVVKGFGPALNSLLGPDSLRQYGAAFAQVGWPLWLVAAVVAVLLILPRPRLRRFLADSAGRTRRISLDGFDNTFRAIGATVCLALPIPLALWTLSWIFITDTSGSNAVYALGKGLATPTALLFAILFFAHLCRPHGVADAHFRWDRVLLERFRKALNRLAIFYAPPIALLMIWLSGKNPEFFQGPGRVVFIVSMVLVSVALWHLLMGRENIFSRFGNARNALLRLRVFWVPVLVGIPLVLALLTALGRFLSAVTLAFQLQNTVLAILAGILAYGLLTRWVIIRERRLALRSAMASREAKLQAAREPRSNEPAPTTPASDETLIPEVDETEFDLATVGSQTRRLIGAIVTVSVLLGVWVIWSEVIPVLKYLDTRNLFGEISIADLISLGLIGVVTMVVFRNLPGLLEVAFLQALDLEGGVRNAISTICQYVVIAIGAVLASRTIGMDWSQFGWIAAALSVGLGFGLQEVVANFVSGLILLFERPIRVGDIVTVAGVDGVVTRIRIRATTITNWDRKEFVVPNKEFITGTLLNWTLSNPVTRIVIPVGIAYGSETEKARFLLLEIARNHPDVMKDPEPLAVFEKFGDSTLDFSLRFFVARTDVRLHVTHQINSEIHRRFAETGIEISFPQRDLHIRSIDPSIRLGNPDAKGD